MEVDEDEGTDNVEPLRPLDEPISLPRKNVTPPPTPPLPLSPISNTSSPSRKRARTAKWRAPSHVPDFLPPFPHDDTSAGDPLPPQTQHTPPVQPPLLRIDKPPSPIPQILTPTTASDFLTQVPYTQSTLATTSTWHLPSAVPPRLPHANLRAQLLPNLQTEQALLEAYHHILTHPPPPIPTAANPLRHKVAMALLYQTQWTPRWDPPDTLYSSIAPCAPRVAAMSPTFPLEIPTSKPVPPEAKVKEEKVKIMPPAQPRPVVATERLTPLISQQSSRIPDLARSVLPVRPFFPYSSRKSYGHLGSGIYPCHETEPPWSFESGRETACLWSRSQRAMERQHHALDSRCLVQRQGCPTHQWKGQRSRWEAVFARCAVVCDVGL